MTLLISAWITPLVFTAGAVTTVHVTRTELDRLATSGPAHRVVAFTCKDIKNTEAELVIECGEDCNLYDMRGRVTLGEPEIEDGRRAFPLNSYALTSKSPLELTLERRMSGGPWRPLVEFTVQFEQGCDEDRRAEASLFIPGSWHARLHLENDVGISDQNYTQGHRLELGWVLKKSQSKTRRLLAPLLFNDEQPIFAFLYGMSIYTPTDISWPAIIRDERPYAGWHYLGAQLTARDAQERQMITWELSLGLLGDAGAGFVQGSWHKLCFIDSPRPIGWEKEFHIKTVPAFYLAARWNRLLGRVGNVFDIAATGVGELGNVFTRAGGGAWVRLGHHHAEQPLVDTIPVGKGGNRRADPSTWLDHFELYGFGRLSGQVVAWNGMLQGGFRDKDPHSVPPRRLIMSGDIGVHLSIHRFFLEVSRVFKSPEIENLTGDPLGHTYWQLQVGWTPERR
jgi:lipid A 3-O-deacylase